MEKSLFTSDNVTNAIEKLFILDRFVQWNGDNSRDIIKFASHLGFQSDSDEIRLYTDNGFYVVPVGGWLVKAPDGSVHAFGEGVRFVANELADAVDRLYDAIDEFEIPVWHEKECTTYYPEDLYETEAVQNDNGFCLRYKVDKDGKPVLKKNESGRKAYAGACSGNKYGKEEGGKNRNDWFEKYKKEISKWIK